MKPLFSEAQIRGVLREAAAGTPIPDLCWNHCISRSTFRDWKAKYGATVGAEVDRLKQLELDNARLRQALARAMLKIESLPGRASDPKQPPSRQRPRPVPAAAAKERRMNDISAQATTANFRLPTASKRRASRAMVTVALGSLVPYAVVTRRHPR